MNARRVGLVLRWVTLVVLLVWWPEMMIAFCALSVFVDREWRKWEEYK